MLIISHLACIPGLQFG